MCIHTKRYQKIHTGVCIRVWLSTMKLTDEEQKEYNLRLERNDFRFQVVLDPITWQILKFEEKIRDKNRSELIRYAILQTFKNLETKLKQTRIKKAQLAQELSRISMIEEEIVNKFKQRLGDKWEYIEMELNEEVREEVTKLI